MNKFGVSPNHFLCLLLMCIEFIWENVNLEKNVFCVKFSCKMSKDEYGTLLR